MHSPAVTEEFKNRRTPPMDLNFQCFKCNGISAMNLPAEERTTMQRILPDPNESREMTFYCDKCGAANTIPITPEMLIQFISRLSSNDKGFPRAIDEAKKRFGF
jgi:hypothetical protein